MKSINKVEYKEGGNIILVLMKEDTDSVIIKENEGRFKLSYIFSLLEGNLLRKLEISGEGALASEILNDMTQVKEYIEEADLLSQF